MAFLEDLKSAERRAFIEVALRQSFPRGSRLMSEGAPASHVMVIESGWTRITVQDTGQERMIAERGPGQLLGERGALRPNVRSATVTALSDVEVLVMKVADFASFLSAHGRVLDVVDEQIWDRLVQDPAAPDRGEFPDSPDSPDSPSVRTVARDLPVPTPPHRFSGENCTVILTDVVGFGAEYRRDLDRSIIREKHLEMMQLTLGPLWGPAFTRTAGTDCCSSCRRRSPRQG